MTTITCPGRSFQKFTAFIVVFMAVLSLASANAQEPKLIPQPRELQSKAPRFTITTSLEIHMLGPVVDEDRRAARSLQSELKLVTGQEFPIVSSPQAPDGGAAILLGRIGQPAVQKLLSTRGVNAAGVGEQGYVLDVEPTQVLVAGKDGPGLFYGVQTLKQLIVGTGETGAEILGARILDWPAMRYRGVLVDLSRGPVPTRATLTRLIDTLADFKINQIYFHMEDSFRSLRQPLIGLLSDTLSQDDWRKLVAHAEGRYIDLIPEQEACGHLHKILRFQEYNDIAERDRGHVLAPGDASERFVEDLLSEMMPLFPSPFFHIGCDETWELGRGRTMERVQKEGYGQVYIDNLKRVYSLTRQHGKQVIFWGDMALDHPELLKELPRDLIVATWEYFPHENYSKWLKPFQDAGLPIIVCPWVGNTNLIFNDYENAAINIQRFVRDGQKAGAIGMMNTSWNDDGETLLGTSWYGFVLGGACSWQPGECNVENFNERFDWAFYRNTDHRFTQVIQDLSSINRVIRTAGTGSVYTAEVGGTADSLFWQNPFDPAAMKDAKAILSVAPKIRLLAEKSLTTLRESRERAFRHPHSLDYLEFAAMRLDALGLKYQVAADVARFYRAAYDKAPTKPPKAADIPEISDLHEIVGTNGRLEDLREYSVILREDYSRLWLAENGPLWLPNMLTHWDDQLALWSGLTQKFESIRREYNQGAPLPAPETLGLMELGAEKAEK